MNAEGKIAEQKNAELMFANLPRIRKLKFRIFKSQQPFAIIYSAFILFSGHSQSFNSAFFEDFETIFILNFFNLKQVLR